MRFMVIVKASEDSEKGVMPKSEKPVSEDLSPTGLEQTSKVR